MTYGIIAYLIIGAIFAAYADYSLRQAVEHPLLGMVIPKPSGVDRIMNAVITAIGWPLFIIKRIAS